MAGCAGRLKASEVEHVFASGWSVTSPMLVVRILRRADDGPCRVAAIAGKKIGPATLRNRARRRLREAIRASGPALPSGLDLVAIVRPALVEASPARLREEVGRALEKIEGMAR